MTVEDKLKILAYISKQPKGVTSIEVRRALDCWHHNLRTLFVIYCDPVDKARGVYALSAAGKELLSELRAIQKQTQFQSKS